jgi:hypothetical protein
MPRAVMAMPWGGIRVVAVWGGLRVVLVQLADRASRPRPAVRTPVLPLTITS